jgi:hypothetical protein
MSAGPFTLADINEKNRNLIFSCFFSTAAVTLGNLTSYFAVFRDHRALRYAEEKFQVSDDLQRRIGSFRLPSFASQQVLTRLPFARSAEWAREPTRNRWACFEYTGVHLCFCYLGWRTLSTFFPTLALFYAWVVLASLPHWYSVRTPASSEKEVTY